MKNSGFYEIASLVTIAVLAGYFIALINRDAEIRAAVHYARCESECGKERDGLKLMGCATPEEIHALIAALPPEGGVIWIAGGCTFTGNSIPHREAKP